MTTFSAGDLLLDRYQLVGVLGRGGMGEVWDAIDTRLRRRVAVKVLLEVERQEMVERFRREAMAIASLVHPQIITIFDSAEHEGRPFIVMELLEGHDLSHERFDSPLQAVETLIPICNALATAHDAGILHRDIKPENIFRLNNGGLKLVDFGLALLKDSPKLTKTGLIHGTFLYIAPEIVSGQRPDARTDQYAVGVLAFELLSGGQFPFETGNIGSSFLQRVQQPPTPLEQLRPDLPRELCRVVNRCIVRNPNERFATMHELEKALRDVRRTLEVAESAPDGSLRTDEYQPPPRTPALPLSTPLERSSRAQTRPQPLTPIATRTPTDAQSGAEASSPTQEPTPGGDPKRGETRSPVLSSGPVRPLDLAARAPARWAWFVALGFGILALLLGATLLYLLRDRNRPQKHETPGETPTRPTLAAPPSAPPGPLGPSRTPSPSPNRALSPSPKEPAPAPEPKTPASHYLIGYNYYRQGKCDRALAWYQRGVLLDPRIKPAARKDLVKNYLRGCRYTAQLHGLNASTPLDWQDALTIVLTAGKARDCPRVEQYAPLALKGADATTKLKVDGLVASCRKQVDGCYDFVYHRMSPLGPVVAAVLPAGGIVVASTGATADLGPQIVLTALGDAIDRHPLWQRWFGGKESESPKVLMALPGGELIVAGTVFPTSSLTPRTLIYRFSAKGELRWTHDTRTAAFGNQPEALLSTGDGALLVAHRRNYRGSVTRLDPLTGKTVWDRYLDRYNPALGQALLSLDQKTVLWSSAALLHRLLIADGNLVWPLYHYLSTPMVRQLERVAASRFFVLSDRGLGTFALEPIDLQLPSPVKRMKEHSVTTRLATQLPGFRERRFVRLRSGELAILYQGGATNSHQLVLYGADLKERWHLLFGKARDVYGELLVDRAGNLVVAGLVEHRGSFAVHIFKVGPSGKKLCR